MASGPGPGDTVRRSRCAPHRGVHRRHLGLVPLGSSHWTGSGCRGRPGDTHAGAGHDAADTGSIRRYAERPTVRLRRLGGVSRRPPGRTHRPTCRSRVRPGVLGRLVRGAVGLALRHRDAARFGPGGGYLWRRGRCRTGAGSHQPRMGRLPIHAHHRHEQDRGRLRSGAHGLPGPGGATARRGSAVPGQVANLVWAVERTVPDRLSGEPIARSLQAARVCLRQPIPDDLGDAKIIYRLMTPVPENWLPFVAVRERPADASADMSWNGGRCHDIWWQAARS